jgi:hypothetical protein
LSSQGGSLSCQSSDFFIFSDSCEGFLTSVQVLSLSTELISELMKDEMGSKALEEKNSTNLK